MDVLSVSLFLVAACMLTKSNNATYFNSRHGQNVTYDGLYVNATTEDNLNMTSLVITSASPSEIVALGGNSTENGTSTNRDSNETSSEGSPVASKTDDILMMCDKELYDCVGHMFGINSTLGEWPEAADAKHEAQCEWWGQHRQCFSEIIPPTCTDTIDEMGAFRHIVIINSSFSFLCQYTYEEYMGHMSNLPRGYLRTVDQTCQATLDPNNFKDGEEVDTCSYGIMYESCYFETVFREKNDLVLAEFTSGYVVAESSYAVPRTCELLQAIWEVRGTYDRAKHVEKVLEQYPPSATEEAEATQSGTAPYIHRYAGGLFLLSCALQSVL